MRGDAEGRRMGALLVAALLLAPLGAVAQVRQLDNGLARTPPMGFNTWNKFACNVNEDLIKGIADAMVSSGMRDAGYQYVVIDDCWQVGRDSATGRIVPDPQRFPHGMRALADYVHSKGLKFGLYTDAGRRTCEGRPGSYQHYELDARTYAEWGVDYTKVDWCYADSLNARVQYTQFRDALLAAGRPIVFSICEWGSNRPWEWAPGVGNLWRTTGDISDRWWSMIRIADASASHARAAGPGGWNDPDMLEVGNGGMTAEEYRVHFSLWAIMAAPLIAGNDIRTMSDTTRDILTNREVIAVDQDSLGAQGWLAAQPSPDLQVWVKPLRDGARAVALVNRTEAAAEIAAAWSTIGLPPGPATVRDLWAHAERGRYTDRYAATVPSHGVVMVRVAGRPAR
jgi:alpha-galactosidase